MLKQKQLIIKWVYNIIDLACIYFAIYLACFLRPGTLSFKVTTTSVFFSPDNPYRLAFVLWLIITISFLHAKRLYQTRREILHGYEIASVFQTVMFSTVILVVVLYVLRLQEFPRSILLLGTVFLVCTLSAWRFLKRLFVGYIVSKGYNNFNAVIIGAGRVGIALEKEISRNPDLGIKVIGFLDDYKTGIINGRESTKVLGTLLDFETIVKREFINKVFVTIHHNDLVFNKILQKARDLKVSVRVVPQGYELMSGDSGRYNIGIIPIIEYCDEVPFRIQFGKRLFDFFVGFLGIIFSLPVFLVIALMIKRDSPGPVFYRSKRYGRKGKVFMMFKFRSMEMDADKKLNEFHSKNEVDGPIFKMKKDPRVTKVGKFLRKYSLDELPQIINVFLGDMSLVGPRPLPIEQIEKEDLRQLERLEVRPGITGLWQIRGRSDLSFRRLVKWDIWYINNWSFWLDLNILIKTIPVVIRGTGAY